LVILRLSTHSFKYCRPMGGCHPNQQPSRGGWWAYENTADG